MMDAALILSDSLARPQCSQTRRGRPTAVALPTCVLAPFRRAALQGRGRPGGSCGQQPAGPGPRWPGTAHCTGSGAVGCLQTRCQARSGLGLLRANSFLGRIGAGRGVGARRTGRDDTPRGHAGAGDWTAVCAGALCTLQGAAGFLGKHLGELANKPKSAEPQQGLHGAAEGVLQNPHVSVRALSPPSGGACACQSPARRSVCRARRR